VRSSGGAASSTGGQTSSFGGATSGQPTTTPTTPGVNGETPDAANEGDKYDAPGTNAFVYAAHDPLSTFGADVDTASYDIFRRDIQLGTLPVAAGVRLEEYVNSFAYDYPAPAQDEQAPFAIHLAAAENLSPDGTALLRVGIQGKLAPPSEKRPANLVFLVDTSGSMQSADKLPLVQQVLSDTIDILSPADTVSIVTYAGATAVRLPPTPASQAASIRSVISALGAGGSTAGAAGLTLAYEQAAAGFIEGGINHIVLCTDGDFNVGPSSTTELLNLVRSKRSTGVTLTTLGFGVGNLNDAMMEAVSDAGNGIYGFISDSAQASSYVQNKMLSTLVHIAKDMKIQVEFNPSHVLAYRLLGYENRAIADNDFRNDVVDAGEVGSGHRVTALYQVVLKDGEIPARMGAPAAEDGEVYSGETEVAAGDWVMVKVRYKAPTATDADPASEVSATLSADTELEQSLSPDFAWAASVATFAEILKKSPYADEAALDTIEAWVNDPKVANRADRIEFAGLFTTARELLKAAP
jgi:Ca-activated chloride channel family protein